MKIGVLICSNSGIDYLDYDKENIKIMRSILNIENKEYNDYVDITAEDFYEKIKDNKNLKISTSQTPTGVMIDFIKSFKKEGYTDIFVITISSKLSGTLSGVKLAADMVCGINVHLFDSKLLSYAEFYFAKTVLDLAKNGKSVEEIMNVITTLRDNTYVYVCVDTLHYLMLNGRLSATKAMIGTLLNLKPLLHFDRDGSLVTLEKIRTKNKAKEKLKENVLNQINGKDVVIFAAYTDNIDEANELLESICSDTTANILSKELVPLTPVVGCHAGPKTCAIGFTIL